jgi:hypothetical protein
MSGHAAQSRKPVAARGAGDGPQRAECSSRIYAIEPRMNANGRESNSRLPPPELGVSPNGEPKFQRSFPFSLLCNLRSFVFIRRFSHCIVLANMIP